MTLIMLIGAALGILLIWDGIRNYNAGAVLFGIVMTVGCMVLIALSFPLVTQ